MVPAAMRQVVDFSARRLECRVAPREWMVETTNRCNLDCPMCLRRTASFRPDNMSLDFFQQLVRKHPEVEAIWPYGYGEPLLHPEIFDFIRYAKARKKTVALSVNTTLLDEHRGKELLDSGLDYLVLPVDGAEETAYDENRYPARLPETEARIETFLKQKQARRSPLHLTLQMIRMKNNLDQVEQFVHRWKRPGVDVVRVRDDLSGLPGASLGTKRQNASATKRPCFFLWRGPLFVQASGTVIPCPYYHGSGPFGDLKRQTALEAWNSQSMVALRAAHLRGDLSAYPVCARCPRHQPTRLLAHVSFFVTTWHIRRIFPKLESLQRKLKFKLFE